MIPNPSNLGCVRFHVLYVHAYHVTQRHAAALGMSAGVIEGIGDKIKQQIVIFRAQLEKALQAIGRVASAVTEVGSPQLLIECF